MSEELQSPAETTADDADDAADLALVAEVVERLDNLWSQGRGGGGGDGAAETPSLIDRRFGKYTIRGVLGRGAFGVVYLATDGQLQRDVALKVPRPEVLVDAEGLARFQSEAAATAKLDHPGIVPVFEANLSGPACYIASAVCSGSDLGKWLAGRTEPAAARDAALFVAQVAEAVHYAHGKGVLHRDLKPSNILLEPLHPHAVGESLGDFQPRLTDFGLAKLLETGLQDTRSSLLLGTPLYIAPEQLSSETRRFTPATDVYALGVVLYELLCLRTPFEGVTYIEVLDKVRSSTASPVRSRNPAIPAELEAICAKCLEKDPADRYATAAELGEDLGRFLSGAAIRAKPITWSDALLRWCRQPQRLTTAGWFTFWFETLLAIWTWVGGIWAFQLGVVQVAVGRYVTDMALVTLFFSLPMALLGWALMRRQARRAFWPAAILVGVQFAVAVHAATQEGAVFDYLYPTAFSKIAAYTTLLIGTTMQLGIYLMAAPAWFRLPHAK